MIRSSKVDLCRTRATPAIASTRVLQSPPRLHLVHAPNEQTPDFLGARPLNGSKVVPSGVEPHDTYRASSTSAVGQSEVRKSSARLHQRRSNEIVLIPFEEIFQQTLGKAKQHALCQTWPGILRYCAPLPPRIPGRCALRRLFSLC